MTTLLLLEKFVKYLCSTQKGTKRKRFPRKEVLIFASELKEYLFSYKKQFTCAKKDDDLESVEKLSHALQIMAPFCKCYDGIEAFTEVLRILIDRIELILKVKHPQLSEERQYFIFTSHFLASYNLESNIFMDEPGKQITTDLENLKVADTLESKCEIEDRERIATGKLQLLHSLLQNQEFKYIENAFLDCISSKEDLSFTIFVRNQKRGIAEINDVRTILAGYELKVEDCFSTTELSLFSRHRDSAELSLALSHRRFIACCRGVLFIIFF